MGLQIVGHGHQVPVMMTDVLASVLQERWIRVPRRTKQLTLQEDNMSSTERDKFFESLKSERTLLRKDHFSIAFAPGPCF